MPRSAMENQQNTKRPQEPERVRQQGRPSTEAGGCSVLLGRCCCQREQLRGEKPLQLVHRGRKRRYPGPKMLRSRRSHKFPSSVSFHNFSTSLRLVKPPFYFSICFSPPLVFPFLALLLLSVLGHFKSHSSDCSSRGFKGAPSDLRWPLPVPMPGSVAQPLLHGPLCSSITLPQSRVG